MLKKSSFAIALLSAALGLGKAYAAQYSTMDSNTGRIIICTLPGDCIDIFPEEPSAGNPEKIIGRTD